MVIEHCCPFETQYQDMTASMQHPYNGTIQAATTVINSDLVYLFIF